MLDRIGQWVKCFPRSVAHLGTGRGIGENVLGWTPAFFDLRVFKRIFIAPARQHLDAFPADLPYPCPSAK